MNHDAHSGLRLTDVSRRFGPRWAVARVSLHLEAGERLMVTGANGSGKTTLLRCLATAIKPQHGDIVLNGQSLWTQRSMLRSTIAYFSHSPRLYDDLNAIDNLRVWAKLGGYNTELSSVLRRVGLPLDRNEPVRTFSAGMRRRLAFGRIVLQQPDLLLLDEPFSALDPQGRADLITLVNEVCLPHTIVVVASHLPQVCSAMCDRGIHMESGQVVWRGTTDQHPLIGGKQ